MPAATTGNRLPPRLTRASDFRRIIRNGRRCQHAFLQLYVLPCNSRNRHTSSKGNAGFIVPDRAVHGAVKRNRVRRMMKEVFRHWWKYVLPGHDIILRARSIPENDHASFTEAVIIKLLMTAGLLTREGLERSGERLRELPEM